MKQLTRLLTVLILLTEILLPAGAAQASAGFQTGRMDAAAQVQKTLSEMTTAEKVGQLFLVSFKGTDVSDVSQIYDLISNSHIGGVILSAANDNFTSGDDSAAATKQMIESLQSINWNPVVSQKGTAAASAGYVPLLVGISQEGNGNPYDQILTGMTKLPDEMAIGATWNTENARSVGNVLGQELSALGINLLLGPSLDVLSSVTSAGGQDIGVQAFGGDPYWVSEMGKAYITGIHEGSNNRIATIAKNFPGSGSSDRPLGAEVGTVRKSLEDMIKTDLAPFTAVTGNAVDPLEVTDGLLISHIRYEGLQGNIRASTRPVSFDNAAVNEIMALPDFSDWRSQGGLLISDDLGAPAVRNFFNPTGTSFDARQVIKNAFMAGSDLLYLGDIQSSDDPDQFTTIKRTLEYFVQKYNEDPSFSEQVDQSVGRILALKQKLYPQFSLSTVIPFNDQLSLLGKSDSVALNVARESVTLISPSKTELDSVITNPPQRSERILFIADTVTDKQCSTCADMVKKEHGKKGMPATVPR